MDGQGRWRQHRCHHSWRRLLPWVRRVPCHGPHAWPRHEERRVGAGALQRNRDARLERRMAKRFYHVIDGPELDAPVGWPWGQEDVQVCYFPPKHVRLT